MQNSVSNRKLRLIPFCEYQATYGTETLAALTEATPTAAHKDGFGTTRPAKSEVDALLKKIGEEWEAMKIYVILPA
ncbi:MAG: hypothetical protein IJ191_07910 [Treponema sp.]|nr:hypothetical protein [Treponema sp.]